MVMFASPLTVSESAVQIPSSVAERPLAANTVPSGRQTTAGLQAVNFVENQHRNLDRQPLALIKHPRAAPSAISSEQYLAAKASAAPVFVHNAAASKMARISNLYADAPRFSSQVDILA